MKTNDVLFPPDTQSHTIKLHYSTECALLPFIFCLLLKHADGVVMAIACVYAPHDPALHNTHLQWHTLLQASLWHLQLAVTPVPREMLLLQGKGKQETGTCWSCPFLFFLFTSLIHIINSLTSLRSVLPFIHSFIYLWIQRLVSCDITPEIAVFVSG